MKDKINIVQDISTLYELSLAIGESLDVNENCKSFLDVVMARRNFSFCSVWVKDQLIDRNAKSAISRIYASPVKQLKNSKAGKGQIIFQLLQEMEFMIIDDQHPDFLTIKHNPGIEKGGYLIYRLRDFGFVKLFTRNTDGCSVIRATQMLNVVKRFGSHLEGCFAHELQLKETNERKKIQRALNISEEKYRTVVRNLSEGIIITDLEGRVTFANTQMAKITGFTTEELLGSIAHDLLTGNEKEAKKIISRFKNRKAGESDEYIVEHVQKSGKRWMGRIKASPYSNIQGEIIGTMGIVSDITQQIEAEQQIIESELKFRKVIDASLDAVVAMDEEGRVIEWNNQSETIFGFTREEAMGRLMSELIIPHEYRDAHDEGMKKFLATGEGPVLNNRIEITALNNKEEEFPIELSISSIKMKDKYIFSAFMRDITERKRAEEEILAAKQAAEQAQKAEQQFLANMSHEIRTPMNAVIGMTHLLYETKPSDSQKEYLDSLRFSADSLMGIINNILDLSKIEAGELEFEKRTFNLVELLKGLQQTFQFKVREKSVSVVIDVDANIEHHLIGDAVRLTQILTNLLGNASKFTRKGTIGVKARIVAKPGSQCILQFNVHDTGIGIDTDKIHMIFENFKQAEVGITRKFGGTGLGLTIVKQLVELQGGTIEVESEKNKGSNFIVTLPFEYSMVKLSEVPVKEETPEHQEEILSAVKLLVVEDNPMNQKLISKILEMWNCNFEIASSGLDALKVTAEKCYDLILMDIHMPEMDGCETTIKIREDSNNLNQEVPIVALTAAALLEEKNRALDSGMNDFLTKPFAPKQLSELIVKWNGGGKERTSTSVETVVLEKKTDVVNVNLSYLLEMSKGDKGFVKDMILIFLKEIPLALDQLKAAFDEKNWTLISDIAHRIKSNYMMLGMEHQQDLALNIEKSIKENDYSPDIIESNINRLKADSKLAYPQLKQELTKIDGTITKCPVTGATIER